MKNLKERLLRLAPKRLLPDRLKIRKAKLSGTLSYIDQKEPPKDSKKAYGTTDMIDNSDWFVKYYHICPQCNEPHSKGR